MFPPRVFIGAGRSDILVFKPNAGCLFEERGSTGVHKYTLKTHPFSQFRTPNELDTESQVIGGACAQRQWHIVVMTAGLRSGLLPSVTATPQPKNVKKTPHVTRERRCHTEAQGSCLTTHFSWAIEALSDVTHKVLPSQWKWWMYQTSDWMYEPRAGNRSWKAST